MFDFINYSADKLQIFLVILFRTSGLFVLSPVLSHRSFPAMAKVGLAMLLSLILTASLPDVSLAPADTLVDLAALAVREILIGVIIGFVFALLIHAVYSAGSLVGFQAGFLIAKLIDPNTGSQESVMTQLWFVVAVLIFFVINGHHLMITALADSFRLMPPGQASLGGGAGELLMKYSAYVFVLALKLAAPVTVTLFLTDVALGALAKMMPSMNIFIVGFPLKICVGVIVMAMSLPVFSYVLQQATLYFDRQLGFLFAAMGKA